MNYEPSKQQASNDAIRRMRLAAPPCFEKAVEAEEIGNREGVHYCREGREKDREGVHYCREGREKDRYGFPYKCQVLPC